MAGDPILLTTRTLITSTVPMGVNTKILSLALPSEAIYDRTWLLMCTVSMSGVDAAATRMVVTLVRNAISDVVLVTIGAAPPTTPPTSCAVALTAVDGPGLSANNDWEVFVDFDNAAGDSTVGFSSLAALAL